MLGDITRVENIYMVCGYTDMRKAIDGLCAVVKETVKRDPKRMRCFCSAGNAVTGLRHCCGKGMVLYCSTNGWK